jgi:hypothetical protein
LAAPPVVAASIQDKIVSEDTFSQTRSQPNPGAVPFLSDEIPQPKTPRGYLSRTPYRQPDLRALCWLLLPHDTIGRIRYFTARIQVQQWHVST